MMICHTDGEHAAVTVCGWGAWGPRLGPCPPSAQHAGTPTAEEHVLSGILISLCNFPFPSTDRCQTKGAEDGMTFANGALVGLELRFRVTLCLMNTDATEERKMAKNVYQGLVMGIFFQ